MKDNERIALELLSTSDATLLRSTIIELLGESLVKQLSTLQILQKNEYSKKIECTSCDNPHLLPVYREEEKYYTVCFSDSQRNYLLPESLLLYSLNIRQFMKQLVEVMGVESDQVHIEEIQPNILWKIGAINILGKAYTVYFARDYGALNHESRTALSQKKNPALFYIQNTVQPQSSSVITIPVSRYLMITDDLVIAKDDDEEEAHFGQEFYYDDGGGIVLDREILLDINKKKLLFNRSGHGTHLHELPVSEPEANMLAYLYNIRDKDTLSVSVQDLAQKFGSGHKSTISGYKKHINDACKKHKVKEIIRRDSNNTYGLNTELDCFTNNTY